MTASLSKLLRAYIEICRMRLGPQDLPCSPNVLLITVGLYCLCSYAVALVALPPDVAAIATILDLLLLTLFTAILLSLAGFGNRSVQTLTALAGTGVIMSAIAFPVAGWSALAGAQGPVLAIAEVLRAAILIWSLLVTAHIYRHALSTGYGFGVLATLACLTLILLATIVVIPASVTIAR
jgi:hypothetical protein